MTFVAVQSPFLGLQSFAKECKDKDMAAMLDGITKEPNEKSFVNDLQHGGDDVTCNRSIDFQQVIVFFLLFFLFGKIFVHSRSARGKEKTLNKVNKQNK
jgi:hypothetical protein